MVENMADSVHQRGKNERVEQPAETTETPCIGLFSFQPTQKVDAEIPLQKERLKLKKLQKQYRKATSNLQSAVGTASKAVLQKDVRLHNLRSAIGNLIEAEAENDEKNFHRWFFVMAKAYEEFENYLETDDETRGSP
jgi:hypothetical protein